MLDRHAARPLAATLLAAAVLVMTATGCGSSNSTPSTTAASTGTATAATTTATTSSSTSKSPGQSAHTPTLIQRYAACLAQNGVNVPMANGAPSFKGVNTSSPQYRKAAEKCRTVILGAERAQSAKGTAPAKSTSTHSILSRYLACLSQNGISVPSSGTSGTPSLKGINTSSAQYRQAAAKCRKTLFGNQGAGTATSKASKAAATGRLHTLVVSYIACLRQNGISVPSSDTSGVGSLKGINTTTPQFKAARTKCESVILSALKAKKPGSASSGH